MYSINVVLYLRHLKLVIIQWNLSELLKCWSTLLFYLNNVNQCLHICTIMYYWWIKHTIFKEKGWLFLVLWKNLFFKTSWQSCRTELYAYSIACVITIYLSHSYNLLCFCFTAYFLKWHAVIFTVIFLILYIIFMLCIAVIC